MPKGIHNGKRGRKRSALPPDIAAKLGPAPLGNPLALSRWFTDAIAVLTQLVLEGQPYGKLLETVRASAGATARSIPVDIIYEANRILGEDSAGIKRNDARSPVATPRDSVRGPSRASRREV